MGRPRGWAAAATAAVGRCVRRARPPVARTRRPAAVLGGDRQGNAERGRRQLRPACPRRLVRAGSATAGGIRPVSLAPLSGRYLSLAEREEIAVLRARRVRCPGDRRAYRPVAVDDLAGAAPQRRDPGRPAGVPGHGCPVARGPAGTPPEGRKAGCERALREYVQDRLAGTITRPDGAAVPGPDVRWIGRRHGRRADRRWARAWSLEQIANRLRIDFPDDESMRVSHEVIYQALYVQGRGALRRELTACLRTGRALRCPGRAPAAAARSL